MDILNGGDRRRRKLNDGSKYNSTNESIINNETANSNENNNSTAENVDTNNRRQRDGPRGGIIIQGRRRAFIRKVSSIVYCINKLYYYILYY